MAVQVQLCFLLFGTCLFSFLLLLECRKLEGYEFPVYSTDVCPRNLAEWKNRSSAINCTESNGYMCLPNENLTDLLEFCYIYPRILVKKNLCLFLEKRLSRVHSYTCSEFTYGCPELNYFSSEAFIYPSCTELEYGCFSAEPNCKRQPSQSENSIDDTTLAIILGVPIPAIFVCFLCVLRFYLNKRKKYAGSRLIETDENGTIFFYDDIEIMETYEENPIENAIFNQWEQDDCYFISTTASKEVEKSVKDRKLVIVAGHSGYGKSAIIQHIALKYKKQGWLVKRVTNVEDIVNIYPSYSVVKHFFVFDDSFGKESFDEILNNSWQTYEEKLKCPSIKVKLLMSCRSHIITDTRIPRYLMNQHVLDINDEKHKLSVDEKRQILKQYTSDIQLSDKDLDSIVEVESYFPLLCKLYSREEYKHKGVRLFTEPETVLKEEILELRKKDKGKYCALALLVFFNDDLCVDNILENKYTEHKFKHTLVLCELPENTPPSAIEGNLDSLKGFLVKKVEHKYHFYHDLVKEVTTHAFGRYYPTETIKYADIGLFRRKIQIRDSEEHNDLFTFYLSDGYIEKLGERFLIELIGNRFIDMVLNPSMKNKKVIEALKKTIHKNPDRLEPLFKKKELKLKKPNYFDCTLKQLSMSKLVFISLEKDITPLFVLIVFGHTDFSLECLNIQQQKIANSIDISLLYAVCCNGSLKMFHMFSEDRVKKFLKKFVFNTLRRLHPIHIVSLYHNYEILGELINIGIDIDAKSDTRDKWTLLHLAVSNDTQKYGDSNYEESGATRRDNTVQLLLSNGADINLCTRDGASPLYIACQNGHDSTVQLLVSKGSDINLCKKDGASPLCIACQNGHVSTVQFLLSSGANINSCDRDGYSPLHMACKNGHDRIVQLLLKSGAKIDSCGRTKIRPIWMACKNGHDSIVQQLLSSGANINSCGKYGDSPLHMASRCGHESTVQLLLRSEAKINLRDKFGYSPLTRACRIGHYNIVQHLLDSGADINSCEEYGYSPLHMACRNGHDSIVQHLLSKGANINVCSKHGYSPLYKACKKGHKSTVQLLLRNEAEIDLCIENKASPLNIAVKKGYDGIEHLLRNYRTKDD